MTNPLLKVLLQHGNRFAPVVPFTPGLDRLLAMDLTAANDELTAELVNDTMAFSAWVDGKLQAAGARYGIGGYGEHRTIYSRSSLFGEQEQLFGEKEHLSGEQDHFGDQERLKEPRRLHLGTDLWGKAGTMVSSPLPATVHSFADNAASGDYGGTIILRHDLDEIIFYTLYGHLSLASLQGVFPGKHLAAGEAFAAFGIPGENGNWPPHLHFQLITDLQGRRGDYPGVCRFSERDAWLRNSPNPDFILQLNRYIRG